MFEKPKAFSGYSVDDIAAAEKFYGETLGIKVSKIEMPGDYVLLNLHIAGDRDILLYPKPDHTPAAFTVLNFPAALTFLPCLMS